MKCCVCKRNIAAGAEAQKHIAEYQQQDNTTRIFGFMMSDGPIASATGRILRAWHHRCFHIVRKREARGDAQTGRVLAGGNPTGYEFADDTQQLSERMDKMREVARRVGKAIGDPTVTEAYQADQHGGPYDHDHDLPLSTYQLLAHLVYAHGDHTDHPSVHERHGQLHAQMSLERIVAERLRDYGHIENTERDWRDQLAVDVDKLT